MAPVPEVKPSAGGGQPAPATDRLVFLDGIRALAAITVVLHHVYQTVPSDGSVRTSVFFLYYGNLAVAVFIVVSGYSLALAASRRDHIQSFSTFIRRRAWRIVPPYIAALLLSIVLILTVIGSRTGTPWDIVLPLSWSGVGVNALLLQDVLVVRAPNYVFWSIAVEWHLYFLFPLLLLALRRRIPRPSLLAIGCLGCALLWFGYGGRPYVGFPPQFFVLFVLGVVAGDLATDESVGARESRSWLRPLWTVVGVTLAAPLAVLLVRVDPSYFTAELVVGGAMAAFIVALTAAPTDHRVRRILEWRPLAWIGLFAYSLYLTHAPVLQIVWQYGVRPFQLGANAEFAATLLGATVASIAVAFVFHLLFERPFMNHRSVRAMTDALRRKQSLSPEAPESRRPLPSNGTGPPALDRAADALADVDTGTTLYALLGAFDDPDADVRRLAVEAIARHPSAGLAQRLGGARAAQEEADGPVTAAEDRARTPNASVQGA